MWTGRSSPKTRIRQQAGEAGPLELRLDDHAVAGGHDPEPQPASRRRVEGALATPANARTSRACAERRVPELVRLVESVAGDPEPEVHQPPVGHVVAAVDDLVERQAERRHDGGVGVLEGAERVDERPVPVEEDRPACRRDATAARPGLGPMLDSDVPETIDHVGIQRVRDAAARKGVTLDVTVFDQSTHTAEEARCRGRR